MTVRIVEGEVLTLGSVSGTDGTPFGIWEPTRAARVYLENPIVIDDTHEQTVINTTASGAGVVIQGGGIVSVETGGQIITVSGPEFTELEGDDVDSINTLTGTVTIDGQNNANVITNVPSNTIFIDVPFDEDDVDSINTLTGTVTLNGSDGNTVLPPAGQTITVQGFRPEFVAASGFLQTQIDNPPASVDSVNTLTGDVNIAAGNNIVVSDNGLDTITIDSFTDDDVDSITVSGTTVTGSVDIGGLGSVSLQVSGQQITISGSDSVGTTGGAGLLSGVWKFDDSTNVAGNPGSGQFRVDSGVPALITEISISDETEEGFDATNILGAVSIGDRIYVQRIEDASEFFLLDVTGTPVDNGNRWNYPVTVVANGDLIDDGKESTITIAFGGATTTQVDSLNSLTGNLSLVGGTNVSITDNGSDTITVNADAGVESLNTLDGDLTLVGQNTVSISTADPNITISGSGIASLGFEDDGIPYIDDPTRAGKRLSVHRQHFGFGRNGNADNTYLRVGDALNNESGWVMPRDATITAWSVFYPGGAASKGFEIRINNVAVALASATVTQDVVTLQKNLNIDIDEGDRLQVFVVAAGGNANDANSSIEVAWRR
jgi:hypothetical protein